jgi:hypothetical protein
VRGRRLLGVALFVAASACAPAPRVGETAGVDASDGPTADATLFQPFVPGVPVTTGPAPVPGLLVSDFEQPDQAIVVGAGTPPRHGSWFSYNDGSATCLQTPPAGNPYEPMKPPAPSPGGGNALRAIWEACAKWGAGVAAHLNDPVGGGGASQLTPYDLTGYTGLTFHAMAAPVTDGVVRVTFPMTDDTKVEFGGACDEATLGPGKCSDAYGAEISIPPDATWRSYTISFASPQFRQEGWGAHLAWTPAHVTSIQLQSGATGGLHDFWIDDVYLTR